MSRVVTLPVRLLSATLTCCHTPTYCRVGMLAWYIEKVPILKTALFGKDTTLVGGLAMG